MLMLNTLSNNFPLSHLLIMMMGISLMFLIAPIITSFVFYRFTVKLTCCCNCNDCSMILTFILLFSQACVFIQDSLYGSIIFRCREPFMTREDLFYASVWTIHHHLITEPSSRRPTIIMSNLQARQRTQHRL